MNTKLYIPIAIPCIYLHKIKLKFCKHNKLNAEVKTIDKNEY